MNGSVPQMREKPEQAPANESENKPLSKIPLHQSKWLVGIQWLYNHRFHLILAQQILKSVF